MSGVGSGRSGCGFLSCWFQNSSRVRRSCCGCRVLANSVIHPGLALLGAANDCSLVFDGNHTTSIIVFICTTVLPVAIDLVPGPAVFDRCFVGKLLRTLIVAD